MNKRIISKESISVIIPIFNRKKDVGIIINNIKNISKSNITYEIVIVDDASSDGTYELLFDSLKQLPTETYKNIIYLKNNINLGVTKTKNIGCRKSKNRWLMFLDSDNTLVSNFLDNHDFNHYKDDIGVIFFNVNDISYKAKQNYNEYNEYYLNFGEYLKQYLDFERLPVVRRDCLEEINWFSEQINGFEGYSYVMISQFYKVAICKTVALEYETSSIDRLSTKENKMKQSKRMVDGYALILKNFSSRFFINAPVVYLVLLLRYHGYKSILNIQKKIEYHRDNKLQNYILKKILIVFSKFISEGTPPNFISKDKELRFKFGKNWKNFLSIVNERTIIDAEDSLKNMLKTESLEGKSFLDIGSGSGLFSLAAARLGANVHSFDYDVQSYECTKELKKRYLPYNKNWNIEQASVLDIEYLKQVGKFDIVYSWGVLHHTGKMWTALKNILNNTNTNGKMFIAIYNDQSLITIYWKFIKKFYNSKPISRPFIIFIHLFYPFLPVIILRFITRRVYPRGMNAWYDLIDWLGGYPFEVAKPDEIINFYETNGLRLSKLKTVGSRQGCNEYVFDIVK